MNQAEHGPLDICKGVVPGVFVPKVLILAIVAGLVGLALEYAGLTIPMHGKARGLVLVAGVAAWAHAAAWVTNGELQSITSALAEFAGAKWAIFLTLWWGPVTILWIVIGSLATE